MYSWFTLCIGETNTPLYSNYTPTEINFKKKRADPTSRAHSLIILEKAKFPTWKALLRLPRSHRAPLKTGFIPVPCTLLSAATAWCCLCPEPFPGLSRCPSLDLLQIIPTSGLGNPFPSLSSHHTSQIWLIFVCSVTLSCPTLCDPMDYCTPGFPVLHRLLEFTQTHVHWVSDAVQPSHPLSSPAPTFNPSQHQGLFQWVSFSYQVAKVLELQHQSFQWIFRTDFL